MTEVRNEMILASAGSGKTYALTTRFIGLLAAGVEPERIAALTFTRKAAG
jgi:ATP-dependent helicase/nuclease subunit A